MNENNNNDRVNSTVQIIFLYKTLNKLLLSILFYYYLIIKYPYWSLGGTN